MKHTHLVLKPDHSLWGNAQAFLWKQVLQPTANVLVSLLNALGHWLPMPWQGRFLILVKQFHPVLPNLLLIGAFWLIIEYMPKRWTAWAPPRLRHLADSIILIPYMLFLLWTGVAGIASLLYFFLGWTYWQLGWSTLGVLALWVIAQCIMNTTPPTQPETSHGSASWQTEETAQQWGRIIPKGHVLNDSYGFVLGRLSKSPASHDSRLRYMGHVLTCAPTGAGKGIGAVIPNLLEYPGSALVLDIKGENYAVTHRARQKLKNEVYLIDPFGVTGQPGQALNWLDILNPSDPNVGLCCNFLQITGFPLPVLEFKRCRVRRYG